MLLWKFDIMTLFGILSSPDSEPIHIIHNLHTQYAVNSARVKTYYAQIIWVSDRSECHVGRAEVPTWFSDHRLVILQKILVFILILLVGWLIVAHNCYFWSMQIWRWMSVVVAVITQPLHSMSSDIAHGTESNFAMSCHSSTCLQLRWLQSYAHELSSC